MTPIPIGKFEEATAVTEFAMANLRIDRHPASLSSGRGIPIRPPLTWRSFEAALRAGVSLTTACTWRSASRTGTLPIQPLPQSPQHAIDHTHRPNDDKP